MFFYPLKVAYSIYTVYRNTWLGNTVTMFVIKQDKDIRSRGFDRAQYYGGIDILWNMLIKFSK